MLTGHLSHGEQRTENYISGVFLNENKVTTSQAEISALYLAPGTSLRLGLDYRYADTEVLGTPDRTTFDLWPGYWQFYRSLDSDWFVNISGAWQYTHC